MRLLFITIFILICSVALPQNKSAYTWIVGNNGSFGKFDGSSNKPSTGSLYQTTSPNYPLVFTGGHSNICDSITGKLLALTNGMVLFDTIGNIIENGDSLVPKEVYGYNLYPTALASQGSIILPKGNGLYYIIIPTVSDSAYNQYWTLSQGVKYPYDQIRAHILNMNANGGMGKIIEKNKLILSSTEISVTNMQACRHANGVDWWLLKQGYDSNIVYRFLFTKDSIYGPYKQSFIEPIWGKYAYFGQNCFSKDGKKYSSLQGESNKLFLADFDRCNGELYNPKVYNIPIDSTGYLPVDSTGLRDSVSTGIGFSPNGQFLYVSKAFNIYQFEYNLADSASAWYNVKRGVDTTWNAFEYYGSLQLGADKRMYIGKVGGGFKQFSVIDYPDLKGSACGFCRKCFRVDNALGGLNSPPNVPDFNLGADASLLPCWPLDTGNVTKESDMVVYPNPANTTLTIKNRKGKKKELFNSVGQMIYSSSKEVIDVSGLSKGIYFIKVEGEVKKVVVE